MPEESVPVSPTAPNVVDLNKKTPKTLQFSQKKFYAILAIVVVLLLACLWGSYSLGYQSGQNSSIPIVIKKDKVATSSAEEEGPNIKKASLGEKVTLQSGLTIQVTSASIDAAYETEKKTQKDYYLKNASQSAFLNSDYFKQSNLILKITLSNTNKVASTYNPSNLRLKDSQDNQYVPPYGGEETKVTIYSLNPGETTKLSASYYVPTDESNFKLIYENAVISFQI